MSVEFFLQKLPAHFYQLNFQIYISTKTNVPIWKYKVLIQYADILKHVFSVYHTYFHRFFEAINSNFITAFLIHLLTLFNSIK